MKWIFAPLCLAVLAAQAFAVDPISDHAAARLLDQASWGPTPQSIAQVQSSGADGWLAAQFSLNTSYIRNRQIDNADGSLDTALRAVKTNFFQNALSGNDQLRQRVAFALSEIWVVSHHGLNEAYAFPPYLRLLHDNAFANYRDIVKAVTLSPAMGQFLDMANNNKGSPAHGTAPNENYARELLQLFTLGLAELNPDGSPVLDANGNSIPSFTQPEVTATARLLTGWTYPSKPGSSARTNNHSYFYGQLQPVESEHDEGQKSIFGNIAIPGGQSAEQDLESLLDALMAQSSMAPFVSKQLIQHLVTSNPSPAYVQRVSTVFADNGSGVRGDMQAVIRAILLDPEARQGDDPSFAAPAVFGHMREPVLFIVNVLRGLNATLNEGATIDIYAGEMGQEMFTAPSVFSFFSPQNQIGGGILAPEFQIYSTQTAVVRANLVDAALYGTLDSHIQLDLSPFSQALAQAGASGLADYISQVFLCHSMSANLRLAAISASSAATTSQRAVQAALYVTLTSGEYQIVH